MYTIEYIEQYGIENASIALNDSYIWSEFIPTKKQPKNIQQNQVIINIFELLTPAQHIISLKLKIIAFRSKYEKQKVVQSILLPKPHSIEIQNKENRKRAKYFCLPFTSDIE